MKLPGNTKYLINTLNSHVQMMDGRLTVKRGEYIQITDKEAEHEDVIFAIRRGWVKLENSIPTEPVAPSTPGISFTRPDVEGTTDLKSLLNNGDMPKEPEVKTEPIGNQDSIITNLDPITQDAKPKRGASKASK